MLRACRYWESAGWAFAQIAMEATGIELLGEVERDSAWEWMDFRAPDGNVYELARRL